MEEKKLYVYIMLSRKKDNQNVTGFHERAKTMVMYQDDEEDVYREFRDFANKGKLGEVTRLYRTVNARDEEQCRNQLIMRLLNHAPLPDMRATLASVCQQVECKAENKWLVDFDSKNESVLEDVIDYISKFTPCKKHPTPNGYAIITDRGFDTREFFEMFASISYIEIKKDALLYLDQIQCVWQNDEEVRR